MMQELDSLRELLWMLVKNPRTGILFVLLTIASITDYRTYKIPNWLTAITSNIKPTTSNLQSKALSLKPKA